MDEVNKKFARVETIKKFRLIDIQLTTDDEEITPTMKLKRKFVNEKFKDVIEAMYKGGAKVTKVIGLLLNGSAMMQSTCE